MHMHTQMKYKLFLYFQSTLQDKTMKLHIKATQGQERKIQQRKLMNNISTCFQENY